MVYLPSPWLKAVFLSGLTAAIVVAQTGPNSAPLRVYSNPPAVAPVDTVFMEDMTWLEISNALKAGKSTVIVPAGGLEATGPFVVLDKHQRMLRASTDMIARKLGNALVAPVIRYVPPDDGNRGNYLGDFNISLEAYKSTLSDICTSLKTGGFREIILIGDHQGAQRGMREVAAELSAKWGADSARVHFVPEYYDRAAVYDFMHTTLGIAESRGGFGDNYYNTSILLAVSPESARLQQRVKAHLLTVNGVNLEPLEKTIANGRAILQMQTDHAVAAIRHAISTDSRP